MYGFQFQSNWSNTPVEKQKKGNMYVNAGETWGAMILERRARREVGHNWGIKMSLQN